MSSTHTTRTTSSNRTTPHSSLQSKCFTTTASGKQYKSTSTTQYSKTSVSTSAASGKQHFNHRERLYASTEPIIHWPPSSTTGFDEALSFSIDRILPYSSQFKAIFLLGDFNLTIPCTISLDENRPRTLNSHSSTVLNVAECLGMSQLLSFPTRRNPHGNDTMPDLIFCDDPNWTQNIHSAPGLGNSDHDSIHFEITTTSSHQLLHRTFHQFHKADAQDFQTTLQCIPWELFYNETNIDETWDNFTSLVHAAVKDVIPIATSKGRRRSPWITSDIIKASRKKNRAYHRAIKNKNNVNL